MASFFGKGVAVAQQMVPIYDLSHNDPPSGYYTAENNYCSWRSQLSRKWKTFNKLVLQVTSRFFLLTRKIKSHFVPN